MPKIVPIKTFAARALITGDAIIVIPTLKGRFDFAFIDAEKSEYFQYLSSAEDKLREGAVVVADNAGIFADQMSDYLNYVRNSGKYQSKYCKWATMGWKSALNFEPSG